MVNDANIIVNLNKPVNLVRDNGWRVNPVATTPCIRLDYAAKADSKSSLRFLVAKESPFLILICFNHIVMLLLVEK